MKDYWQLRETLSEATQGNWVRPSDASIRKEYQIEYLKHLIHELPRNIFPNEAGFVKAVKAAPEMVVTAAIDSRIENRSNTSDMEELLDLISGYRSFPKFRNADTLKVLEKRIAAKQPVDMPIVVKFPGGRMRILAGNTRMDIAFMRGITPKVILLDLAPYLKSVKEEVTLKMQLTICELLAQPSPDVFTSEMKKNRKFEEYHQALTTFFETGGDEKGDVDDTIAKMAKCPNRAAWTYFADKLVWRGLKKSRRYIKKFCKFTGELKVVNGRFFAVCDMSYLSYYPVQSWSYDWDVAEDFASTKGPTTTREEGEIQIILEHRLKREESFLTPELVRHFAPHAGVEKEILRVSREQIKVKAYVSLRNLWVWTTYNIPATTHPDMREQEKLNYFENFVGTAAAKKMFASHLWKKFESEYGTQ